MTVTPIDRNDAPVGSADTRTLDEKVGDLNVELTRLARVVVAFSGGADSSFLAAAAHRLLGVDAVHCVTAVSPSLAGDEEADCRALAAEWGPNGVRVNSVALFIRSSSIL